MFYDVHSCFSFSSCFLDLETFCNCMVCFEENQQQIWHSMAIQGGLLQEKQKKLEEYMAMPLSYLAGGCKFTDAALAIETKPWKNTSRPTPQWRAQTFRSQFFKTSCEIIFHFDWKQMSLFGSKVISKNRLKNKKPWAKKLKKSWLSYWRICKSSMKQGRRCNSPGHVEPVSWMKLIVYRAWIL